jgi:hypothetical protein
MRDKARIKPFMEKLTQFWEAHRDLRFGQIIYMLADKMEVQDIFSPEEDKWMKALDELDWNGFKEPNKTILGGRITMGERTLRWGIALDRIYGGFLLGANINISNKQCYLCIYLGFRTLVIGKKLFLKRN